MHSLASSDSSSHSHRHLNILAVDDEAGTRASLNLVLSLAGHHAVFAKDGDEALELCAQTKVPFDLIITDHEMARVSGLDFVRGLRQMNYGGEIVVLTAYAGSMDEEEYHKLNVAGVMDKPFDLADLRQWLGCINTGHQKEASQSPPQHTPKSIDFYWFKPSDLSMESED